MHTIIGRRLRGSPRRLTLASALGCCAVIGDLALVRWRHDPEYIGGRWFIALVALVGYLHLAEGDAVSLGLTAVPVQGWAYWARIGVFIGLIVALCVAAGAWAWLLLSSRPLPLYRTPPGQIGFAFLEACLFAPVMEETIYRLAVCLPLAALGRCREAIVVSGALFGALHFVYGNPSPENLVSGYFLA